MVCSLVWWPPLYEPHHIEDSPGDFCVITKPIGCGTGNPVGASEKLLPILDPYHAPWAAVFRAAAGALPPDCRSRLVASMSSLNARPLGVSTQRVE